MRRHLQISGCIQYCERRHGCFEWLRW